MVKRPIPHSTTLRLWNEVRTGGTTLDLFDETGFGGEDAGIWNRNIRRIDLGRISQAQRREDIQTSARCVFFMESSLFWDHL